MYPAGVSALAGASPGHPPQDQQGQQIHQSAVWAEEPLTDVSNFLCQSVSELVPGLMTSAPRSQPADLAGA